MSRPAARRELLRWYDAHRRRLPWRERPTPYRVWVSEIMLQQTQVATVLPYFRRFMKRFPTIAALARADERDVLRQWAGLGYYSRARSLHRAAKEVTRERAGRLPREPRELRALPGIGRYTAAAIASIAFGEPHELVDGNVARVIARLRALRGDPRSAKTSGMLWKAAGELLDRDRPGDWNQALMDLGARVCLPLPDAPDCGRCPLSRRCEARRLGIERLVPAPSRRPETVSLSWTVLRIRRGGKLLLWKRDAGERFLPGHWGLPEPRHLRAAGVAYAPARAAEAAGPSVVRHSITRHRIRIELKDARLRAGPPPAGSRWVPVRDLRDYLVSSLWRKAAGIERR